MKVGDKLYCYCNIPSDFTVGKVYIVFNINSSFSAEDINDDSINKYVWVKNDRGYYDWFSIFAIDNYIIWYVGNWFYTIQEIRKIKLDFLCKSSLINSIEKEVME